jgi:conjugative transfer signal peptidase TraF
MRRLVPTAVAALAVLATAHPKANAPPFLWNITLSAPIGLYWLVSLLPGFGQLAAIRLPEPFQTLAAARHYLPAGALLIKPIAAHPGDRVCRLGALVSINGRFVAVARVVDRAGRPLPRWTGCRHLNPAQIFVLSAEPDSFDSRYFGPVDRRHVLGTAVPVWVGASRR